MPGYELSSDEEEPALQPDNLPENEIDLDDVQPQIGPAILQQQPAQQPAPRPFDFASFMRRSGGNTTTLLSAIREADAHLPAGHIFVYSERAGGALRCNILHIKHILHILMD